MHKRLKIPICILLITIFQPFVQASMRLYQLDPKEEDELLPKLKHLLGVHKGDDSGNLKSDLFERREKNGPSDPPFSKSVLVKRVVPHGYRSSNYEYDSKLNTIYKPMVRYHMRKPVEQQNKDIINDIDADENKDPLKKAVIVLVKKDKNEEIDQMVRVDQEPSNDKELLRQLQKLLNKSVGKPKGKWKRKLKKRFRGLLGSMKNDDLGLLRSMIMQKSGEQNDPYAPGKIPTFLESSSEKVVPKPKFTLPYYPFWNYWTYQKNIIQDECPGNLIKINNMCLDATGHRKAMDTIKKTIKNANPRKFGKPLNNINLKKK